MIVTRSGVDTSLEPTSHLAIPEGFTWPSALAKLITEYDKAYAAWSDCELKQLDADADIEPAGDRDKAALIKAVTDHEPDPGCPNQQAAERAVVYAMECSRQAATEVNRLHVDVIQALPEHRDALVTQAIKWERDNIAAYAALFTEAQELVAKATRLGHSVGSLSNFITDALGEGDRYQIVAQLDETQWPAPYRIGNTQALTRLVALESTIDGSTSAAPAKVLGKPVKVE